MAVTPPRPLGTPADALALLARVLPLAVEADEAPLAAALADGARALLCLPAAALVPPAAVGEAAARLREDGDAVLAVALPGSGAPRTLVLAGPAGQLGAPETTDLALAVSAAAATALAAHAEHEEIRREAALKEGLARAGRTLQESLDLSSLLKRICREAAGVVEADGAALFRAGEDDLAVEAAYGFPPELVGWTTTADPEASTVGQALAAGRPVWAGAPPAEHPAWEGAAATVAAPVDWDGRLRGVLCATYRDPGRPTRAHAETLHTFAELAGAVFANASAHTGLAMTARTDALTGCLNHAALHDGLRREVERAERAQDGVLSLVLLDLELPGEDAGDEALGDEVLRRAGHALRSTTRPYDLTARYGGESFALVTVEADEAQAAEIAARAIGRLSAALEDVTEGVGLATATAGVAEWMHGMTAGDMVARADRALMYGRRAARRGEVIRESDLPPTFAPGRGRRRERRLPAPPAGAPGWTPAAGDELEPLRARARQLRLANRLAMRLAGLATVDDVVAATVEELRDVFGYAEPGVLRADEDGRLPATPVELLVPVALGEEPWGALTLRGPEPFGDDDQRLLETIAGHVAAAVAAVARHEELNRARKEADAALATAVAALRRGAAGGLSPAEATAVLTELGR